MSPLASMSKRKAKSAERTCGRLDSLNVDLNPTPFLPMRPGSQRLLELPASHKARTSVELMPSSLFEVHTAARAQCRVQLGETPRA